jgi:hypothetical protein
MALAAQQRVTQSFSLARMLREHEETYESCAAPGGSGRPEPVVREVAPAQNEAVRLE